MESKPNQRRSAVELLAAGKMLATSAPAHLDQAVPEGGLEDFALAWLRYWRSLGHDVTHQATWIGRKVALGIGEECQAGPLDLPPHLAIWNGEQHSGATRAMEALLDMVPGARNAVHFIAVGRA